MSEKTVIVIGGGPAGLDAARAAARSGAQVTLVSEGPIGGRAGWHSLLPSKVWLSAADAAAHAEHAAALGLVTATGQIDAEAVLKHIKATKAAWNNAQAAAAHDERITVVTGVGALSGNNRVTVSDADGETVGDYTADAIILAPGSVPVFPPALKPNGKTVIAPRFASALDRLPATVAVIGAGATGCEFAYAFQRLGVQVTWIIGELGVLPGFDAAAGAFMRGSLAVLGVRAVPGVNAERIEPADDGVTVFTADGASYAVDRVFVAIGRKADVARLNLAAAGLSDLTVDAWGQTAVPGIYAVGDAIGNPMVANKATAAAWVVGRHAAGVATAPFMPEAVVAAVYTEPQVAQVGRVSGAGLHTAQVPFSAGLKGLLSDESDGFLLLAWHEDDRRVSGALAAGAHAAEALAPVSLAVRTGATVDDLALSSPAYPTISELAAIAAREAL